MFFQNLYENMTLRSNPLDGEDFVSDLQNNPQTSEGEKSGSSPFSGETYVDYHGKYTTKLKMFFPNATDDQIEALIYFKKNGMQKAFKKLYFKLYHNKPGHRRKRLESNRQNRRLKYANDPEWRRKELERNMQYRRLKYSNNPEYRRKRLESNRQNRRLKYANDPEYRRKELQRRKQKYANDPEYRRKKVERENQYRRLKKLGTFNQFVQDKNPEV
jgi:hypothetical protein